MFEAHLQFLIEYNFSRAKADRRLSGITQSHLSCLLANRAPINCLGDCGSRSGIKSVCGSNHLQLSYCTSQAALARFFFFSIRLPRFSLLPCSVTFVNLHLHALGSCIHATYGYARGVHGDPSTNKTIFYKKNIKKIIKKKTELKIRAKQLSLLWEAPSRLS